MTVKELEAILCTVKNKNLPVCMNGHYIQDINGYFYGQKDNTEVFLLSTNSVQPRIVSEK